MKSKCKKKVSFFENYQVFANQLNDLQRLNKSESPEQLLS